MLVQTCYWLHTAIVYQCTILSGALQPVKKSDLNTQSCNNLTFYLIFLLVFLVSLLLMFPTQALQKKQLIASGKLDKYGKPNESTPKEWMQSHPDIRFVLHERGFKHGLQS